MDSYFKKDEKTEILSDIQHFFLTERDEEISEFAAESLLIFIQENIAPHFYNAGIHDAKKMMEERFASIEDEVLTLEKRVNRR